MCQNYTENNLSSLTQIHIFTDAKKDIPQIGRRRQSVQPWWARTGRWVCSQRHFCSLYSWENTPVSPSTISLNNFWYHWTGFLSVCDCIDSSYMYGCLRRIGCFGFWLFKHFVNINSEIKRWAVGLSQALVNSSFRSDLVVPHRCPPALCNIEAAPCDQLTGEKVLPHVQVCYLSSG